MICPGPSEICPAPYTYSNQVAESRQLSRPACDEVMPSEPPPLPAREEAAGAQAWRHPGGPARWHAVRNTKAQCTSGAFPPRG